MKLESADLKPLSDLLPQRLSWVKMSEKQILIFIFFRLKIFNCEVSGHNNIDIKSAELSYGSNIPEKLEGCPMPQRFLKSHEGDFFLIDPHNGPELYFWGLI